MEEAVRSGYGALGAAIELEHKRGRAHAQPRKRPQRAAEPRGRLPQRLLPLVCAVVLVVAMASYRATRASP